jgi:Domain of unknown function (DUF4350)
VKLRQGEGYLSRLARYFSTHRIWWHLFLLSLVSCISVYVGLAFDSDFGSLTPETVPLRSIFNAKPSGLKGLDDIAKSVGLNCRAWTQPYRNLKNIAGTLIIDEPLRSLSVGETEHLLDWVSDGNRLIYIDYFPFPPTSIPILKRIGLSYRTVTKSDSTIMSDEESVRIFSHVKNLTISSNARITGGNALVSDQDGAFITEIRYDKGRIFAGLMSGFCANKQLQNKHNWDNFQFMINLISTASGSVYFDERCHGYSQSANVFVYLLRNTPGLVVSQLALILAIAVASCAQRFGPINEIRPTRQISNWQFIDGLANAYAKSGAQVVALEIIVQDFKSKLCKILTLPTNASTTTIVSTLQDSAELRSGNLADFLADYEQALKDKHLSDTRLKQLVSKSDEISNEINNTVKE